MKKNLIALILAFAMILTLTACRTATIPENADPEPSDSGVSDTDDSNVADPQPSDSEPVTYPENTRYHLLPDGTVYAIIDNPEDLAKEEWDPYTDLLHIGYTFVRENNSAANSFQKLGIYDEWNGLTIESAESAWGYYVDVTYPDIPDVIVNHQTVRFTGEMTFTGKAELRYGGSGDWVEYITFVLDEECSSKMPVFISWNDEDEFGYRKNVFFLLTEETQCDEIEKLLLDGKEVSITVTTDDFTWRFTDYGLSIDGSTHGLFNNIIDFDYTVK